MITPITEGFFWYKDSLCEMTVIQTEYRPDNGELYAFCIGFSGGTPIRLMRGSWLGEVSSTKVP